MNSIRLSTLEEVPIHVSADRIRDAMQPFLRPAAGDEARSWRAAVAVRRRAIFGRLAKRLLGAGRGDTDGGREECGSAWAAGHERYQPELRAHKVSPWVWRGERLLF